jgi:hypothetical protein
MHKQQQNLFDFLFTNTMQKTEQKLQIIRTGKNGRKWGKMRVTRKLSQKVIRD